MFIFENDDIKSIITGHLMTDKHEIIKKIFMTYKDDELQSFLLGKVDDKFYEIWIENLDPKKSTRSEDVNFWMNNYNKIYYFGPDPEDEDDKYIKIFYESYSELRFDLVGYFGSDVDDVEGL